ncbi:uncharacterized protein METZ01_LOCUS165947 [marine metagenome]|uniref:Sugar O-methyltransferase n=1 Tax=marine metagenome TaxID=408172 RepID=A0A382BIU9_9ZZZZ
MTERYKMVTLEDNEDITSESYDRACDIGATLRCIYSALPRGEPERLAINDTVTPPEQWRHCSNEPVHTEESQERIFSSSYEFVNRLRWNGVFTGYTLDNVLNGNQNGGWTDQIARDFTGQELKEVPDWSVLAYPRLIEGLPDDLVCRPPALMGEVGWLVDGAIVNRDTIAYQERLCLMHQFGIIDLLQGLEPQKTVQIIEIGGGYGGLGYFLGQIFKNIQYVICDLPVSLYFSATYLSEVVGANNVGIYDGNNPEVLESDKGPRYVCLPNHFFDHLAGQSFDLAINTMSFIEMPGDVVDHYARGLKSLMLPEGMLFEQNYYFLRPDAPPTHCEPRTIIEKYFRYKLGVDRGSYWGIPNLWVNHLPVELMAASKIPFHKS